MYISHVTEAVNILKDGVIQMVGEKTTGGIRYFKLIPEKVRFGNEGVTADEWHKRYMHSGQFTSKLKKAVVGLVVEKLGERFRLSCQLGKI